MAIMKTFLCFSNTRVGTLICGCYTLITSLICLVFYLFRYVGYQLLQDSPEYRGIVYAGFVLYGLMITASLVLIPGVQLDKKYLLLPWVYILVLNVLYETGAVALLTTVHMEREKTLHAWEIIWVFFYCFKLIANCSCFACVVSQYQELSEGRGTYDYLYKPRSRRCRRRCRGRDYNIDTFELPVGMYLPYYEEENPHKDYSPPDYEVIYPRYPKDDSQTNETDSYLQHSRQISENSPYNAEDIQIHYINGIESTELSGNCQNQSNRRILQANSHYHSRGDSNLCLLQNVELNPSAYHNNVNVLEPSDIISRDHHTQVNNVPHDYHTRSNGVANEYHTRSNIGSRDTHIRSNTISRDQLRNQNGVSVGQLSQINSDIHYNRQQNGRQANCYRVTVDAVWI